MPDAAAPAAPTALWLPLPTGSDVGAPLALLDGGAIEAPANGEALPVAVPAEALSELARGEMGLGELEGAIGGACVAVALMLLLAAAAGGVAGSEAKAVPGGKAPIDCPAAAGDADGDTVDDCETVPVRVVESEG